jgi:hypothetical protein
VAILAALSLAGSVVLGSAANGIAVFMLFGAGLVAGLLGQIGEALGSSTLDDVAEVTAWVLPFEALYQAGLSALTAETAGFTRFAIDLGPSAAPNRAARCSGRGRWCTCSASGPRALGVRAARPVGRGPPKRLQRAGGRGFLLLREETRPTGHSMRSDRPLPAGPGGEPTARNVASGLAAVDEVVVDLQRRRAGSAAAGAWAARRRARRRRWLGELARLVHLRDDVAAADQLALDEELRDRRPVRQRRELLADRGSGRTSTAAYGACRASSAAAVRAEKPHMGRSGVPFMKRMTSLSSIALAISSRRGDSLIRLLRSGAEGQGVDPAAELVAEDGHDPAVLLEAREARELGRDDRRAEVLSVGAVDVRDGSGIAASMRSLSSSAVGIRMKRSHSPGGAILREALDPRPPGVAAT